MENPISSESKLPYILDILPHVHVGDNSPVENLKLAITRWQLIDRPHLVADAAFGGFDTLKTIADWGGTSTMSCPSGTSPWLWDMLSTNLPAGNWRGAENSDGIVAAIHAASDDKGKKVHQQLLSTGWRGSVQAEEPSVEDEEQEKAASMPRFTKEALQRLKIAEL